MEASNELVNVSTNTGGTKDVTVSMRKEATLKQWKRLYDACNRIHDMEPWSQLWDMDLIEIESEEHEPVYFSVMGRNGECYGIAVYEGEEGLNCFNGNASIDMLSIRAETMILNQRSLTCYWGAREELSDKQRKRIKDMGYKYRGRNAWLYFVSYEPGYYPYDLDQDEVKRLTIYMEEFIEAYSIYNNMKPSVPLEKGYCYSFKIDDDHTKRKKKLIHSLKKISTNYAIRIPVVRDEIVEEMKTRDRIDCSLELNERHMNSYIDDEEYDRPAAVRIMAIADANSGYIFDAKVQKPKDKWPWTYLNETAEFIMNYGCPREITVPDEVAESVLSDLCQRLKIRLKVESDKLSTDEFFDEARF